jgi:hypothetical protein
LTRNLIRAICGSKSDPKNHHRSPQPISLPRTLSALPTAAAPCCSPPTTQPRRSLAPPPPGRRPPFLSAHRFPAPPTRPRGQRRGPLPVARPRRPEQGEAAFRSGRRCAPPVLPRRLRVPPCLEAPAVGDGPSSSSSSGGGRCWRTSSTAP